MIRHELIPLSSPGAWREALAEVPHELWHTWEYCSALRLTVPDEIHLYCYRSDEATIVCPLLERSLGSSADVATLPGFAGFVGTGADPGFSREWARFAAGRGWVCGYLALHPCLEGPSGFDPGEVHASNSVYVLDLRCGPEALFAALDRNRRRQLRDWDAVSAGLLHDRGLLAAFLVREYPASLRRLGASPSYERSGETLARLCELDNVLLVGAGTPERVEAVHAFAFTPHAGTSLFSVSLPEGRRHTTHLIWHGIRALASLGVPFLNLGGGVREDDGVARAKQRFGCRRLDLRCLKQVYQPEVYALLCARRGADPADRSGYFPAYRNPRCARI